MGSTGLGGAFYRLWAAAALSNLGDGVGLFVLPLIAVSLSQTPSDVALLTVALTVAWPLFGLHAGLIVDRVDRQVLLTTVNAVRAGALAALTFALATDGVSLWMLYGLALALGLGETLADTALTSSVPAVVDHAELDRANARLETTINVAHQFLGPPLAGLLAAVALQVAAGTAAAMYALAAAALLAACRHQRRLPARRPERTRGELVAGMTYLWRHPLLRRLTLVTAAMNLTWAAWIALIVVVAVSPGSLGLSPTGYGFLLTSLAIGGVIGAGLVAPLRDRIGTRRLLILDVVGSGLLLAAPAFSTSPGVVAVATLVAGAGSSIWRVLNASIRQTVTPDHLLGRVYAASRLISWGALPLGAAFAGSLADHTGVRAVFAIGAAINLALLLGLRWVLPGTILGAAGTSGHTSRVRSSTTAASDAAAT